MMLTRLIESRYRFMRNDIGAAASVAIHLILITVAAYMTTVKAVTEKKQEEPHIPYVYMKTLPPSPAAATHPSKRSTATANPTRSITPVSFAINPNLPPVNIELVVGRRDDFGESARGVFSDEPANATSSGTSEAYDEREVDTPASSYSARVPVYPPALRAAGIEGRVVAQFIVDASGRATPESFRILSASNDLFSEAVRKSVMETRFTPARLRGKAVSQMVQQLFVFRLDR